MQLRHVALMATAGAFLTGCEWYTHAEPMGRNQYMIECVQESAGCAREAAQACPRGFDVTSNSATGGGANSFRRMTMTIHCWPA
jgi:hypothetical protein